MWYAIIGLLAAAVIFGILYISFRAANFDFIKHISGGRRWLGRLLCLAAAIALLAVLWCALNVMNALVCMVHLVVFWIICDLAALIVSRLRRNRRKKYYAGAVAAALCALYLAAGWYAAHHVWVTNYEFETDKLDADLRIVQITDSHIGATFHADKFSEYIEDINALSPDVVVVTGDFVDDSTSRDDMIGGCEALGAVEAKYGVFFVFGNHDRGYYSEKLKGWTNAELRQRLTANGVTLLEDKAFLVDGRFYVVGRRDRYEERLSAAELASGLDKDKYVVLLDHQPYDFDAEADAGYDLVLCGHTHGGQFIPINHVGEWMGENCLRYGHEKRQNTDFIVSSGISNWTFKFKTGCHSEYVVIDIKAP